MVGTIFTKDKPWRTYIFWNGKYFCLFLL